MSELLPQTANTTREETQMARREVDDKEFFGGMVVSTRPPPDRGKPWVKNVEMPTSEEVVAWLKSKHISLFGAYFLLEKERPEMCAQWILDQVSSFLEWRKTQ
jgi:hypothetical protein